MARHVVAATMLIGALLGHARGAEAQEEDTATLAAAAGVDEVDLLGAASTTRMSPRAYLAAVGEYPQASRSPRISPTGVWDRLAACESSGNWHANTGNGYRGGLQMDTTFWQRYGGAAFASRPDLASREQQILIAERGLAVQGFSAWPVCSRVIGAR